MLKKFLLSVTFSTFFIFNSAFADFCSWTSNVTCTPDSIAIKYDTSNIFMGDWYNPNPNAGEPNVFGPKLNLDNAEDFKELFLTLELKPVRHLTGAPKGEGNPIEKCKWFMNYHNTLYNFELSGKVDGKKAVFFSDSVRITGYTYSTLIGGCVYPTNYSSDIVNKTFTIPSNTKDIELKVFNADPYIKNEMSGIPAFLSDDYGYVFIKIKGNK